MGLQTDEYPNGRFERTNSLFFWLNCRASFSQTYPATVSHVWPTPGQWARWAGTTQVAATTTHNEVEALDGGPNYVGFGGPFYFPGLEAGQPLNRFRAYEQNGTQNTSVPQPGNYPSPYLSDRALASGNHVRLSQPTVSYDVQPTGPRVAGERAGGFLRMGNEA